MVHADRPSAPRLIPLCAACVFPQVPEKRFWHIKIKALAASGQWEALRQFAAEKKSPVGYKPFAQACIQYKQPATSTKAYIDRITQMEDRSVGHAHTTDASRPVVATDSA